jgi:hypothetical protein
MFKPGRIVDEMKVPESQTKNNLHLPFEQLWNLLSLIILLTALIFGLLCLFLLINHEKRQIEYPSLPINQATTEVPNLTPSRTQSGTTQDLATLPSISSASTISPSNQSSEQRPEFVIPSNTLLITPAPTIPAMASITPAPTLPLPIKQAGHYVSQPGNPHYVSANQSSDNQSCEGLSIAGQVFNVENNPVIGLNILVEGKLKNQFLTMNAKTGDAPQYGPGGYEIVLANKPIKSDEAIMIQVYSPSGETLSPKVEFWTYDGCEKNLIVMNFIEE